MTDETKPFVIKSWKPEQLVDDGWTASGLRFRHEKDAEFNAASVWSSWKLSVVYRAAPSSDPPNAFYDENGDLQMIPKDES